MGPGENEPHRAGVAFDKIEPQEFAAVDGQRLIQEALLDQAFVSVGAHQKGRGGSTNGLPSGLNNAAGTGVEDWVAAGKGVEAILQSGGRNCRVKLQDDLTGIAGKAAAAQLVVEGEHEIIAAIEM
jgi:hypothetical protein